MTSPESCPICRSEALEEVLRIEETPVYVGTIWPTRKAAMDAPVGAIQLTICLNCGFIFNSSFSSEALSYTPAFDIALHHSPTYQAYLEAEATRLIDQYRIRNGTVVEIGCGSGHFLRLICRLGENDGFGFDPTLPGSRIDRVGTSTVTLANDLFTSSAQVPSVDLVASRSVLESIADPVSFLATIRQAISGNPDAILYFEVPNASWVFTERRAWNVYYEHCSYFTADLLPRLFAACGFETLSYGPCYDDDQHLHLEAKSAPASAAALESSTEALQETMHLYRRSRDRDVQAWRERLNTFRAAGKRVALWGAGGRGITFLNAVCGEPGESLAQVEFALDINPARQGKFLPRTGQEVVAPAYLGENPVDAIVLTNATYEAEVREELTEMSVGCEILVL